MKSFLVALLSALFVIETNAQVVTWLDGGCPKVTTKANFDLNAYMGRWYDIEKYPNSFQDGSCGIANYTLLTDGTVKVNNTEVAKNGLPHTAIGQARPTPGSSDPGRLQLRFSSWQPWGKYWVLDTDYKTFSVVYSCSNYLVNRVEFLFVLGRTPKLAPEVYSHINSLLAGFKIDASKMVKTNQTCVWQK